MERLWCLRNGFGLDSTWHPNRLRSPTLKTIQSTKELLDIRNGVDREGNRFNDRPPDHKTGFQGYSDQPNQRSTQERVRPLQIHFGLKNDKPRIGGREIQNGHHSKGVEVYEERDVGMQNRPQKRDTFTLQ